MSQPNDEAVNRESPDSSRVLEKGPREEGDTVNRSNRQDGEAQARDTSRGPSETTSMSALNRWKAASRTIKEKSAQLADKLGRPPALGADGLDSAMHPEEYGAAGDIEMTAGTGDNSKPERNQAGLRAAVSSEAHRLVRGVGRADDQMRNRKPQGHSRSNTNTSELGDGDYSVPVGPNGGVLSALLQLHASQLGNASRLSLASTESDGEYASTSGAATPKPMASGTATPTSKREKVKWYKKSKHQSTASLVQASMNMSRMSFPITPEFNGTPLSPPQKDKKKKKSSRKSREVKLTVHIAEILVRQRYIIQLCRALMKYGAPTHRLEEYMQMTAKVLEVEAQFLYLPGCMIMSFNDPLTCTAEVKVVRIVQGIDLGRLAETHNIYKNVVHDMIPVEQAIDELDEIMKRKPRYNKWILVVLQGLASACIGPYAFSARPVDMPIIFILGCLVGFMQHILLPHSVLYSNVFEVTVAVLTSFLARAFGSIQKGGEDLFCFSAITQSSIALILPGFSVLCSSLELQSHQMIAGSIRLVYTIIYSLFLGYGVTVGTTIYGLIDDNATNATSCSPASLQIWSNEYAQHIPFVAAYCFLAALINQGRMKQTPVIIVIGTAGYVTNYFCTKRLGSSQGVANTVGAFTLGLLGNLYSRLWHGHAVTAIIPGIFTLVPSGLASSGSILSGMEYANQVKNGTAGTVSSNSGSLQASLTGLGYSMIQIAIGITVGLFMAALVVYPSGKRRTGLFSL